MRALLVGLVLLIAGAARADQPHTLTGDIRYHKAFHSKFLERDRDIIVYLPPGYKRNKKTRYPVLYMHDGNNLFDGATSFIPGKEWQIDETVEKLIAQKKIRPLIVVGIYNTDARTDEYTPSPDAKVKAGGKADLYGKLIVEELKPFIDKTYRTLPEDAGLGGSSLGGLVSLYLGFNYPAVFGKLAVISPSVWWDDRRILRDVAALPAKTPARIWVDIGTAEGYTALPDARLLRDALLDKGWALGRDLDYFEAEGAEHNETGWAERFGRVLEFLYPN